MFTSNTQRRVGNDGDDGEFRAVCVRRLLQDRRGGLRVLRDGQRGDAGLVYARFVLGNLLDGVAQHGLMVEAEGRDPSGDGPRDDVGRIVQSANAYLQDSGVDAEGEEGVECQQREEAEVDREDGRVRSESLVSA